MSSFSRRSLPPTLAIGALALMLSASPAASARPDRAALREAHRAMVLEERTRRAEERAARARERATQAEERRRLRAEERAARHAAGAQGVGTPQPGETPPAQSAEPEPSAQANDAARCRVTLEAASPRIVAGQSTKLLGELSCPSGVSAVARALTIQSRQLGAGGAPAAWSAAGVATSATDGSFELATVAPVTSTLYRVREGAHGAHAVVKVAPLVTLTPPSTAVQPSKSGRTSVVRSRTTFGGNVTPAQPGVLASLQVLYTAAGDSWHTVALGRVGADGSFAIAHRFKTPGPASVRVIVHSRKGNLPGVSEPLSFEAPQAQNPQLTIDSSADPVAFGAGITISGVAAGPAGQAITLLTHTSGGSFAPVASTTTGNGGTYSFSEAPLENTYYEVTGAGTSSATLFEGVKQAITLASPPSSLQVGQPLTLVGTIAPAHASQPVYLERQLPSSPNFHPIASGATDSSGTNYSVSDALGGVGTYVLRVRVAADAGHESSVSAPFTVTVTPAP